MWDVLKRLYAAESGSIMVLAAFALTAVMAMSGLAVEVGNGYYAKVRNQRVADMAALGAAEAYQANGSASQATQVATDIVAASGLAAGSATVTLPYTSGTTTAVKVQITTQVPIRLMAMTTRAASYSVTASGVASLPTISTPACIVALASNVTYGVSITGGTSITASGCAVATNSGVSATSGTFISAKQVVAGKTVYDQAAAGNGSPGITTTPTAHNIQQNKANAAGDPVGSDSRVIAGFAKLGTHTTPTAPSGTVADWNFDYNHTGPVATYWNSSTSTYIVPSGTNAKAANMSVAGGMTVTFQGTSTVTMSGSLTVGGGGKLYMGATTLDVGGEISVSGGAVMSIASGNTAIGANGTNAVYVDGGSSLTFGNGTFSANGNIVTSGGTTINFGATASHYINGALTLAGSSTFGAGAYYINGNFTNNTGGSMTGTEVTFFLSGALTLSGGTSMNLAAPTSDSGGGVTDLLFATKSTAQTKLGGGAQSIYAGMVYAPYSDMVMDGGAGATGNGRCFALVVNTFTMNGGTTAGTACTSFAGSSGLGGAVALIQ